VSFVLRRKSTGKERLGVVLKVNGENTLHRQRQRDIDCTRWILDPGDDPITIRGFQTGEKTAVPFKVLSREASKEKEVYYGEDVGTISMVVFREKQGEDSPPSLTEEAEDVAALSRGIFPKERPKNLGALRVQLRTEARRGLLGESKETVKSVVNRVSFKPDPTPVMAATITYYRP
jgi:hypothetical protein